MFVKKIGRYFAELTQFEENGKIVLHKSLFSQKKEPYAKLKDIRQKETSSEGGVSSISRTEESSAPAISLESRGDVISESKDTTTEPITQEVEQENVQPTLENVAEENMAPRKISLEQYLGELGLSQPMSDYMLDKQKVPNLKTDKARKKLEQEAVVYYYIGPMQGCYFTII